jgi:hypothetical protein
MEEDNEKEENITFCPKELPHFLDEHLVHISPTIYRKRAINHRGYKLFFWP